MENRWKHLYPFLTCSGLSCPAHFRKQFSEENSWNQLNNWKNHPCSFHKILQLFFGRGGGGVVRWYNLLCISCESNLHHTWIMFKLKFTFIFSSCAANDFSKSSCFFMRASTLSSESPKSLLARKACNKSCIIVNVPSQVFLK